MVKIFKKSSAKNETVQKMTILTGLRIFHLSFCLCLADPGTAYPGMLDPDQVQNVNGIATRHFHNVNRVVSI
jgi:hypothetical protein